MLSQINRLQNIQNSLARAVQSSEPLNPLTLLLFSNQSLKFLHTQLLLHTRSSKLPELHISITWNAVKPSCNTRSSSRYCSSLHHEAAVLLLFESESHKSPFLVRITTSSQCISDIASLLRSSLIHYLLPVITHMIRR